MYEAKRRKLHREPADDSPTRSPVELDREDLNQPETSPSRNFPRDLEEQGNPLTYGPKDRAQFEASRGAPQAGHTGTAAKIRVEHGLVKRLTQGINEKDARSV
ncbi:hypothetical protein LTR28_007948 [Elasticomyces elasticus]|nr:hypothetical protein LTR28_007948 [Elasticomyces elasticus]